jgi:hypothetical protein
MLHDYDHISTQSTYWNCIDIVHFVHYDQVESAEFRTVTSDYVTVVLCIMTYDVQL